MLLTFGHQGELAAHHESDEAADAATGQRKLPSGSSHSAVIEMYYPPPRQHSKDGCSHDNGD